ncbi:MAG: hypothetical protein JNJ42_07180 [Burkholderiaceae bacterium]|nr:hypothetical protein [Burkholderiaceae bacterium]
MAQQINLYVPELRPPRPVATATQALLLTAFVACSGALAATLLQWQAAGTAQRSAALQQQVTQLQTQLAARPAAPATARTTAQDVDRLRQRVAAQQRVVQALDGSAPDSPLPSDYLFALARQAQASVWLTGFVLSADERALEIRGRMLDASALPAYLQRLNAEPRFKGRSFAQLEIRPPTAGAEAAAAYPEFTLRSAAPSATTNAAAASGATQ